METSSPSAQAQSIDRSLRVLVVDDEPRIRQVLRQCLQRDGHHVEPVATAEEALQRADDDFYQVAFLDLRLPEASGLDLIEPLLERNRQLKIVVITAHASIESAVEAIKRGAADYLPKPFSPEQIRLALRKVVDLQALEDQVDLLESDLQRTRPDVMLTSESPAMQSVLEEARLVADSEATVLLRGESGTGKGVLARAIHQWSPRSNGPFAVVHAPSLSPELLESELFGHVKGAFTGATQSNPGRIAQAKGGTLFLDEIADLPLALQPKILRFVEEQTYERVGDPETHRADVRLLAATNHDLEAAVEAGEFREDLLYRLNVIELEMPPLRERTADVLPLAERFAVYFSEQNNRPVSNLSPEAEDALTRYDWPGNVRELRNAIERAVILARGDTITPDLLPMSTSGDDSRPKIGDPVPLDAIERAHIKSITAESETLAEAAETLGIDTSTLWRFRKKHGLA